MPKNHAIEEEKSKCTKKQDVFLEITIEWNPGTKKVSIFDR